MGFNPLPSQKSSKKSFFAWRIGRNHLRNTCFQAFGNFNFEARQFPNDDKTMNSSESIPRTAALVCAMLALGGGAAMAAATTYSNEANFLANVAADYYLNDFSNLASNGMLPSPRTFSSGSWSYVASAPGDFWVSSGGIPVGPSLSLNAVPSSLTISFNGASVTAVGGYFFAVNALDVPQTTPTVTVVVSFADATSVTIPNVSAAGFLGITSGRSSITKVEVKPSWVGGVYFASLDHFYVGKSTAIEQYTALEEWRQTHFGSPDPVGDGADDADPAHDGIVNLIKYAFGLDPKIPASPSVLPRPLLIGSTMVLSFTETPGVSGITYGAEWSSSMADWSWSEIPDTGTPPQHMFSVPFSPGESIFVRFRISNP